MNQLEQKLRTPDVERERLLKELRDAHSTARRRSQSAFAFDHRTYPGTAVERVGLFQSLFVARSDAYPRRWENAQAGRSGYFPRFARPSGRMANA